MSLPVLTSIIANAACILGAGAISFGSVGLIGGIHRGWREATIRCTGLLFMGTGVVCASLDTLNGASGGLSFDLTTVLTVFDGAILFIAARRLAQTQLLPVGA